MTIELVDEEFVLPTSEQVREQVAAMKEEHTPAEGYICKTDGCGGNVVRRVRSQYRGQFGYGPPTCDKCRREYLLGGNAPTTGEDEFLKIMRTPITI